MLAAPTATATREGDLATVHVGGYLSTSAEEALGPAFAAAAEAPRILTVFAADAFLNSAGIGVLLRLLLRLKDQGKDLRVVHPSAHFRRVFAIVGLEQDVPVYASAQQALAGW
ncbi:MAG: STAS domain-containing protein [Candidatus Latescibacterota bacterium]